MGAELRAQRAGRADGASGTARRGSGILEQNLGAMGGRAPSTLACPLQETAREGQAAASSRRPQGGGHGFRGRRGRGLDLPAQRDGDGRVAAAGGKAQTLVRTQDARLAARRGARPELRSREGTGTPGPPAAGREGTRLPSSHLVSWTSSKRGQRARQRESRAGRSWRARRSSGDVPGAMLEAARDAGSALLPEPREGAAHLPGIAEKTTGE